MRYFIGNFWHREIQGSFDCAQDDERFDDVPSGLKTVGGALGPEKRLANGEGFGEVGWDG